MNDLGVFFTDSADAPELVERIRKHRIKFAVSMRHNPDLWRQAKAASPGLFVVGRHFFDQQPYSIWRRAVRRLFGRRLSLRLGVTRRNPAGDRGICDLRAPFTQAIDDPIALAGKLFNEMLPDVQRMHGVYDAWVFICEPTCWNGERARQLAALMREWSRLMHAIGEKTVAYYFSTGHPGQNAQDLENLWAILADHGCDYVGINGYDAPTMDHMHAQGIADGNGGNWTIGRHRRIRAAIAKAGKRNVPFIYVEGPTIDGGVSWVNRPRIGWKGFCTPQEFVGARNLGFAKSVLADPDVVGGGIFCHDGDIWNSFAIWDQPLILEALAQPGAPSPQPNPAPNGRPVALVTAFIKSWEPFHATWYDDGRGHQSIMFGHQGTAEEIRLWTQPARRWQGLNVLALDVANAIAGVNAAVHVPLTDNQWGALVDFRFNLGQGHLLKSDLLAKVNRGDYAGVGPEFDRWVYFTKPDGTKVIVPGLVIRRAAERELWEAK